MSNKEKAMEGLKSFNLQPPSAGTTVQTVTTTVQTVGPSRQDAAALASRRVALFFRGHSVETPGSGNLMKGNRRAAESKGRRK